MSHLKRYEQEMRRIGKEYLEACKDTWPEGSQVEFHKGNGYIVATVIKWDTLHGWPNALVQNIKTGAKHRITPGYDLGVRI